MALASPWRERHRERPRDRPMVISTTPQPPPSEALLHFLRGSIGLSESALALGLKQAQLEQAPLPVVLWRFGLISLEQFDAVLAWQDHHLGGPPAA